MFVIRVGDRVYIGRKGGPNSYSLVKRSQDARRFKFEEYANRLDLKLMDSLMQEVEDAA